MKIVGLPVDIKDLVEKKLDHDPLAADYIEFASDIRYLALNYMLEKDYAKKTLWLTAILEECDINIEDVIAKLVMSE